MTTGRINQVTIVAPAGPRAARGPPPLARGPRGGEMVTGGAWALQTGRQGSRTPQQRRPARGQGAPQVGDPPSPPEFPRAQSAGARGPPSRSGGRAPPRRSRRRPQPRGSALQRSLQVRGLLLLLQKSGRCQAPTEAQRPAGWWPKPPAPVRHPRGPVAKER